MKILAPAALALLIGCSSNPAPVPVGPSPDVADAGPCDDRPVGTLCGGDADAGIRGECNANGICEWTSRNCATFTDCAIPQGPCFAPICKDGLCSEARANDGSNCQENGANGLCVGGVCEVDAAANCATVKDCPHWMPCVVPACVNGTCASSTAPDGTACHEAWVFGHCLGGACE